MKPIELLYAIAPLMLLTGCDDEKGGGVKPDVSATSAAAKPSGSTVPAVAAVASAPADAGPPACLADASWFKDPQMPTEVPLGKNADNCSFHQFEWQMFLDLVKPSGEGIELESWMPDFGVFVPANQKPVDWGKRPPPPAGCNVPGGASKHILRQVPRLAGLPAGITTEGILEAGSNAPLVDKNHRWVQFEVTVNKTQYDYLTQCDLYRQGCFTSSAANISFPAGSVELKTAWRIVETCDLPDSPKPCKPEDASRYYTTKAVVTPYGVPASANKCQAVTVALVGLHAVHKTPLHPEWIWATFEHVDNAPDCTNPAQPPPGGWTFNDPSCDATKCPPNAFINACNPTDPTKKNKFDPTCAKPPIPTQVCRKNPEGGGSATNMGNIISINESIHKLMPASWAVWKNYKLVGGLWKDISQSPPTQAGSLLAANTTAETYLQTINCFACHTPAPVTTPPNLQADFSHVFGAMQGGGACPGTLPPQCTAPPPSK